MQAAGTRIFHRSDPAARTKRGEAIACVGVAIGAGAFVGSGLLALAWAGDHLPGWNDSVFSWTLSIIGIVAGGATLASAACFLALTLISVGARVADPTGERERFWGVSRRERLFASQELRRAIASEDEDIAPAVRNALVDAWPVSHPKAS